jgi:hypothetical protein
VRVNVWILGLYLRRKPQKETKAEEEVWVEAKVADKVDKRLLVAVDRIIMNTSGPTSEMKDGELVQKILFVFLVCIGY